MPLRLEQLDDHLAYQLVVVNDQDREPLGARHAHRARVWGYWPPASNNQLRIVDTDDRTLGRPLLVTLAAVVSALTAGFAPRPGPAIEIVLVENWTRQRLDSRGVPETWRAYDTIGGRPAYDFAVVEIDGGRALRMRSHGDHSTIAKKIQIDLNATPWLEWSWKVVALPDRADIRQQATSDAAAHVFVVWPHWPEALRARLIGYLWDASLPVGSIHKSQKTASVTFIVVHSAVDRYERHEVLLGDVHRADTLPKQRTLNTFEFRKISRVSS
ncbi:MAG: hypothetical protein DMD94_05135 [Candidatus Rokuibacteriota bacterium]|nr:MAG: hypothetical protein DMD94_05135 [Candidatus Rokubacteria bacterium]